MASPGWGGLEKVFVDLTNRLSSTCDVIVLTPEGAEVLDRLSDDVAEIGALPRGSRRNPITLWRLRSEVRRLRPDVVHSHAAKAAELVHHATRWLDVPHVATKHNTRSRRIFDRVGRAVAVSQAVADTVHNPRGVTVVYNGIELRPRDRAPADAPATESADWAPATDVFEIVAVGRLHPAKGFDRLIRQVAGLAFPFRLRIAGEGRARPELEELIEDLDLGDRVELLGHREDVPELLARAHLQVVSSRTEGFSLALLEGLFYARALLSTPVGVAREVLPDSLIVEPGSMAAAVTAVRGQYDEAVARLADARRRRGERFLLSETAKRYLSIYEQLLGGR